MKLLPSNIKFIENYHILGGHKIFCKYFEMGFPSVVFEAGLGDSSESWSYVQKKVSEIASTFSYDRLGCGKSDKNLDFRTCQDLVYGVHGNRMKIYLNQNFHSKVFANWLLLNIFVSR